VLHFADILGGYNVTKPEEVHQLLAAKVQKWWKEAVVYQIYPRSFMDSNDDGIGDLKGIKSRLDYLKELGVDVLWLCPVSDSPNDDNGYDIRDYYKIMAEFGTMSDFEELLAEIHKRNMRLVMDMVVNHTSDENRWFQESRSAKDNPYRDWYIWRDGKNGQEPNNWVSYFSGSAWEYDETTNQYYLHLFSRRQPDLNWENPKVREAIYNMMNWWLDKGVDGFRLDAINLLSKADGLPSVPGLHDEAYVWGGQFYLNGPKIHDYLQEMNERVFANRQVMTVGETGGIKPADALLFAGEKRRELNMVFQFEHMDIDASGGDKWTLGAWDLQKLRSVLSEWQIDLHGKAWNSLYWMNHDQPRSVSRFGNDGKYRAESAKMLATVLHMMQGTPYIYQGEEIGMTNVAFATIDDYRDVEILNLWNDRVVKGGQDENRIMHSIHVKARDNSRTPMQWNNLANAGFTSAGVNPWIRVNPNYKQINVEQALADTNSIFYYYKQLIQLRKNNPIMVYGKYDLLLPLHEQIYAYTRTFGDEKWLVVANFSDLQPAFRLPNEVADEFGELVIGNYTDDPLEKARQFTLRPYECRVYKLD
jgi:oligo-1,6-glucosidase